MKRKWCKKFDAVPQLPVAQQIFYLKSLELTGHKRIIREKDAKEILFNNRTEAAPLLITYKAIRCVFYSVSKVYNIFKKTCHLLF